MSLISFKPAFMSMNAGTGGYGKTTFVKDLGAGVTVAIVALPLALAFAIASGLPPQTGLLTAIVAGFLISSFSGSRVQIGGPAGAFIVIVYGIVQQYGVGGLLIATVMSGVMLFLMGVFRLGVLVRFIPVAVIVGFTNGIAVLIMLSQIKDFFGLQITKMPAEFFSVLKTLGAHASTWQAETLLIGAATLLWIVVWQFVLPKINFAKRGWPKLGAIVAKLCIVPGSIVALVLAGITVHVLGLQVETIGSRFGTLPANIFIFSWPAIDWQTVQSMLLPAMTLAVLGAIESLLCARVADGLSHSRSDPNQELMAQGIANFITPLVGGMPATGTIARTVTNIKSGAQSPVAGITHALVLLLVVLFAAPLAQRVPLASLSAILLYVAWNMGEWREFAHLKKFRWSYRIILLAVFVLTIVLDLTVAIGGGRCGCLLHLYLSDF